MLITLTTDFGQEDAFVGIIKGVIYSLAPNAKIVDLCHQIEPGNIAQASYTLKSSWCWFPKKTVHIVVVDPGVGSERRAIAGEYQNNYFVGPDNGILTSLLPNSTRLHSIVNPEYINQTISSTFHGRDVFAPAGTWLAKGVPLSKLGPRVMDPIAPDLPQASVWKNTIRGQIIYADHFGNLTSNISAEILKEVFPERHEKLKIRIGDKTISGLSSFYNQKTKGSIGAIINSWNMLEIFCNNGHAAKHLHQEVGGTITISSKRSKL